MPPEPPTCPIHEKPMEHKGHHKGREIWKCPNCTIVIDRPKSTEAKP